MPKHRKKFASEEQKSVEAKVVRKSESTAWTFPPSTTVKPGTKPKPSERDEAWYHAACLSIAEGVQGWDQPLVAPGYTDSLATKAVRDLRTHMLELTRQVRELKPIPQPGAPITIRTNAPESYTVHCGKTLTTLVANDRFALARKLRELADIVASTEGDGPIGMSGTILLLRQG